MSILDVKVELAFKGMIFTSLLLKSNQPQNGRGFHCIQFILGFGGLVTPLSTKLNIIAITKFNLEHRYIIRKVLNLMYLTIIIDHREIDTL